MKTFSCRQRQFQKENLAAQLRSRNTWRRAYDLESESAISKMTTIFLTTRAARMPNWLLVVVVVVVDEHNLSAVGGKAHFRHYPNASIPSISS